MDQIDILNYKYTMLTYWGFNKTDPTGPLVMYLMLDICIHYIVYTKISNKYLNNINLISTFDYISHG